MRGTYFKAKDAKSLYVRLTPDQHALLANEAASEGLSLNTYVLRTLGFDTPFEQYSKPRGRKPNVPLRVNLEVKR